MATVWTAKLGCGCVSVAVDTGATPNRLGRDGGGEKCDEDGSDTHFDFKLPEMLWSKGMLRMEKEKLTVMILIENVPLEKR